MTLNDRERDRLLLATARGVQWLMQQFPYGALSDESVELIEALEKFPIIREAPRR